MTAPSPAAVRGGRVLRLATRRRVWTSALLTPAEADQLAAEVRALVRDIGDGPGMLAFACGDGRLVDIRARELESIELCTTVEGPLTAAVVRTAEEIAEAVVRP